MYRDTAMPQVCVWVVYDCLCACWHDWVAVTAYLAAELKTLGCGPALPRKCTLTCDLASVRGSLHAVMIAPDCHPPPPQADRGAAAPPLRRAAGEGAGEALRGGPRPPQPAAL